MAYKVFAAGEEALASDVNTHLMSQTISRHASASARSSAITAPTKGQMTVLDTDVFDQQVYTGSAWNSMPWSFMHYIHSTGWGTVSGTANVTFSLPSFTFPRACTLFVQLQVYITYVSGSGAFTVNLSLVPSTGPGPTTAPQSVAASNPLVGLTVPVTAFYRNVSAGTVMGMGLKWQGGTGPVVADVGAVSGWVMAIPVGSEF
jgi:hypothetical protein